METIRPHPSDESAPRQPRPHSLAIEEILAWADAHHRRTGRWPTNDGGAVAEAPDETWHALDRALRRSNRGLPAGYSLARLLEEKRGVPNRANRPELAIDQILAWADAYRDRTGRWPAASAGPIPEAPRETWSVIDAALRAGNRGLARGSSLARLLAAERGTVSSRNRPPLSIEQILAWADAHYDRTGQWPGERSGPIPEAPGEQWSAINTSLTEGSRGLPGGSSLPRLLQQQRGVRNRGDLAPFTLWQVLAWADDYYARYGDWPTVRSGPIDDSPGETWGAVDSALTLGTRGLPGGASLHKMLQEYRDK
jgi:hypothetical protein